MDQSLDDSLKLEEECHNTQKFKDYRLIDGRYTEAVCTLYVPGKVGQNSLCPYRRQIVQAMEKVEGFNVLVPYFVCSNTNCLGSKMNDDDAW